MEEYTTSQTTTPSPHIIILPSQAISHLIPLTELAKRLVYHHNFSITFTIPSENSPTSSQKSLLDSLPNSINSIYLPPVDFNDLPSDTKILTKTSLMVTRSMTSLRDSFKTITATHRVVAFIVDLFGTDAFDVAREFKIPPYVFFPSTAMCLSFFFSLPEIDSFCSCEFRDLPNPIQLPGCVPIHGSDLLAPAQDRKGSDYEWLLYHCKRYKLAEGVLLNSFVDLEPRAIKAMNGKGVDNPTIHPIGPLTRIAMDYEYDEPDGLGCLKWLDNQPVGSVLFISFGSHWTLSHEQLIELAFGLELSEQRFLWVFRAPDEKNDQENTKDPFDFLPKGFVTRTKGLGLVVSSWAPQTQVLSHGSTGGFLTHCGWNSTLESIEHGIPMIAWPLFAEQKMNAVLLVEDLKVALRPKKTSENNLIDQGEIARVVKELMDGEEGKKLQSRMRDLTSAAASVSAENGSSSMSLAHVAETWKHHKNM